MSQDRPRKPSSVSRKRTGRHTTGHLSDLPPTLTVDEAGEMLGISRRSAYRAAARGELPTLRLGRRLLVPTPRLLALLGLSVDMSTEDPPGEDTRRLVAAAPGQARARTARPLPPPASRRSQR